MATQTGTLKAGYQLVIDIANGDASTTFDYSVSGTTVRDNGKAWKSDRVIGPFTEDVTYSVTYSGSPSIYKVQPNGQREYTAETLPDPATLVAGDSVVLTGTFAADVTSVLLTVDYVKGVKSWTGTVVSANDPVNDDGLPNGVTWVKV